MLSGPIARTTLRTSVALGLRLGIQAGSLLLLVHVLGAEDYGRFAGTAALAVILGTLATFGTHTLLLAEIARDDGRANPIFPVAISTTLLCGALLVVVFLVLVMTCLPMARIGLTVLVCIGIAEIILQPLLSLPGAVHQGTGRVAASQLLTTLPLLLRLISAGLVLAWRPLDPLSWYAIGYLLASIVAVIVGIRSIGPRWPRVNAWRMPRPLELRQASGYAILALTAMGPAELDKTLALRLLSSSGAGIYAASARAFGALTLPVIALMLSATPQLFREGTATTGRSARLLRWIFAAALGYSLLLMGVLWMAAPFIESLFGTQFLGMAVTLRWLTFALPGIGLRIAAGTALMSLGSPWTRVLFELTGLAVLLGGALTFGNDVPAGMPIALGLSETIMAAFGWCLVVRALRSAPHPR